jgi:hypothetical protein
MIVPGGTIEVLARDMITRCADDAADRMLIPL